MPPELETALALARDRHEAIVGGDSDRYAALEAELAAACEVLAASGTPLTAAEIPELDELIALETSSRVALEVLMAEVSARMDTLRASARANGAYARSERFSVNGR